MEIVSYVLEGALAHKDSMGNGTAIRPGDVQRMSAGTGVMHSEFNHAPQEVTHFLQIWILPAVQGIAPGYEQKHFDDDSKRGAFRLLASPDGRDGSVQLHANASMYAGLVRRRGTGELALDPSRKAYVHVARGSVQANGRVPGAGDALMLSNESGAEAGERARRRSDRLRPGALISVPVAGPLNCHCASGGKKLR
jgi:redox-sensitive bicupin YhaK (pirin superfamily)